MNADNHLDKLSIIVYSGYLDEVQYALVMASAAAAGPERAVSKTSEPSGRTTRPRSVRPPPESNTANPAMGGRHDPSSAASMARSAVNRTMVGAWMMRPTSAEIF